MVKVFFFVLAPLHFDPDLHVVKIYTKTVLEVSVELVLYHH